MLSKKIDFDKLISDLEQGFTVQDAAELQGISKHFLHRNLTEEQKNFVIATRKGNENKIPHKKKGFELKAFKLKKQLDVQKKEADKILNDKNNIINELNKKISQLEYDLSKNDIKENNNKKELNENENFKKEIKRLQNIHENDVITGKNYIKLIDYYKNIISKYEGGDKLIFDKTEYEKSVKPILDELETLRKENKALKNLEIKDFISFKEIEKDNTLLKDNLASFKLKLKLLTKDYEAVIIKMRSLEIQLNEKVSWQEERLSLVKIFGWMVAIVGVLFSVIWFYQKVNEIKEMISNYSADNIYVSECIIVEPRKEFKFDDISDFKIDKNIYIDTTYWIKVQKVNPSLFDSNKPYLYQVSKADTSMFKLGTKFNSLVELEKNIK